MKRLESSETALLVFCYDRPEHLRRLLSSLESCPELPQLHVRIHVDGAKNPSVEAAVAAVLDVALAWTAAHGGVVLSNPFNEGLAEALPRGVSCALLEYGTVIVLEDDLEVAPGFLGFMLRCLEAYESDPRVMQVSGYTFSERARGPLETIALPISSTWGWGTWARAWRHFPADISEVELPRRGSPHSRRFSLYGAYEYRRILAERLIGRNNSWGILWWYAISNCRGLVIFPSQGLVRNLGFDGSGVHGRPGDPSAQRMPNLTSTESSAGHAVTILPPVLMPLEFARLWFTLMRRRTQILVRTIAAALSTSVKSALKRAHLS